MLFWILLKKKGISIKLLIYFQDKNNSEIKKINWKLSETDASAGHLKQLTRELKAAVNKMSFLISLSTFLEE